MNGKNGGGLIALVGILVVAFTIAAFFLLDIEKNPVNKWALVFLVLSEVALFGGLTGLRSVDEDHNQVFLKSGVTTSLSLYFIVTLASIFFAGLFQEPPKVFIVIEVAILLFFAIVTISICAWSPAIARRDEADREKIGTGGPKRGEF
ncbi:MAG: hypothetical protein FWD64_03470 [Acidobacteriaceae bacterium]|nr:hypothetical protein [Acidobacteriaceae bacterium]